MQGRLAAGPGLALGLMEARLMRTKQALAVVRPLQPYRTITLQSVAPHRRRTAAVPSRLALSRQSILAQARPQTRSLPIAVNGLGIRLAAYSSSATPSVDSPTTSHAQKSPKDLQLKKLVGLPCPGCGAPFQIDHPQDPGYLTRTPDRHDGSRRASSKMPGAKDPLQPVFDPNAKSMTHAQYEDHLKTLDPKILEEMGITFPAAPINDGSSNDIAEQQTADGAMKPALETDDALPLLSKPPVTKPAGPERLVCHRCHSLSHHASPLANSSILPSVLFPTPVAPVPKHLETLKQSKTATVVLVVDLIDFPLSLPSPVVQELLKVRRKKKEYQGASANKNYPVTPIILVGNKFDVMPLGTHKHNMIQVIRQYLEKHDLAENVRAIHLISAKNPVGDEIKMLLKSIGTSWVKSGKGNVVMIGAENVGKSQLLNAFLKESGRWKPNVQQVQRAKYGVEQQERQRKLNLLIGDAGDAGEDKEWATMTGMNSVGADMDQYEEVYKVRGLEKLKKYQTTVSNVPGTTLGRIKVPLSVLSKFIGASYKEVQTKWLMDTPGIRTSQGQLTSWLTLDELKVTIPKKILKPASFTLEEGKSFFLGGLVRIDCVSIGKNHTNNSAKGASSELNESEPDSEQSAVSRPRGSNPAPKFTVFSTLPFHKTSTTAAERLLEKTAHGELTVLQPPFGSPERLAVFPGLKPVSDEDIIIINQPHSSSLETQPDPFAKLGERGHERDSQKTMTRRQQYIADLQLAGQYGICDLVFSGLGWIMVSGKFRGEGQAVTLRVWTPNGQGSMVRDVCLLPELAANPVDKTAGGIRQKQKIFMTLPKKLQSTDALAADHADAVEHPLH
ncbi:hypothetical protein EDD11_008408 [Mortierella claussenii]|nr:hypothetical protein EDD11_008408 [Mortierella claussenii]